MGRKTSSRQRLQDIIDAIDRIRTYTADADLHVFTATPMLYDAVIRNIEVISEATRHIPESAKAEHPQTPWRAIADIGNVLRYAYDRIDDHIVWSTVQNDLEPLRAAVEAMIGSEEKRP